MDFLKANEPFAVSALIIGLGYLFKRLRILKESDGEILAGIALNITLPAVILLNVPNLELSRSTAVLPAAGLLLPSIMATVAFRWLFRRQVPTDRGLSLTASSGYNIGLFAMPMVAGIYGAGGVARFALLDLGNVIAVLMTANYLARRHSPLHSGSGISIRQTAGMFVRSVPFLTYIVAVAMNLAGWRLSGLSEDFVGVFAGMNRGAALLTLGVLMRFRFPEETWKAILPPLVYRYVFGILLAALVLFVLPLPPDIRVTIAGMVVMPMGLTLIPFAVKWGYDRNHAAAIINMGIPVSFILFWIIWLIARTQGAVWSGGFQP